MSEWKACPPPNTNPGNPWVVRDEHNTVIAIMGGFKSSGERIANQIVADHAAISREAALRAAINTLAAFVVVNDNGYTTCRACKGFWHTGDTVRHRSDCPVLVALQATPLAPEGQEAKSDAP